MDTYHRVGLVDIVEDVPVHIEVTHTHVVALAEAGGIAHVETGSKIHGDVAVEAITFVTIGITLQDGVVVGIVGTEIVVDLIRSAGDGQVVHLVHGELLVHLVIPVRIDKVLVSALIGGDGLIAETVSHLGHVGHGVFPFHEGRPALHIAGNHRGCQAHIGHEAHGRFSHLSLLGGDEDDTVLGAQTVNGGGSVLQHGDALDVFRIQFLKDRHVRVCLQGVGIGVVSSALAGTGGAAHDTVHHNHGSAETTQVDFGGESTGLAAVLGNQKAGNLALQGCYAVGTLGGGNILGADLGDGAREGFLLLDAVAHDHGLIQHLGVFHQDDVHLGSGFQNTGFEAYGSELEDCTFGNDERKVTVNVGSCAHRRTLLHDRGPDDGFLLRIRDRTGHRDVVLRE